MSITSPTSEDSLQVFSSALFCYFDPSLDGWKASIFQLMPVAVLSTSPGVADCWVSLSPHHAYLVVLMGANLFIYGRSSTFFFFYCIELGVSWWRNNIYIYRCPSMRKLIPTILLTIADLLWDWWCCSEERMQTNTAAGAIILAVCLPRNGTVRTDRSLLLLLTFYTFSSSNYLLFHLSWFCSCTCMHFRSLLWT